MKLFIFLLIFSMTLGGCSSVIMKTDAPPDLTNFYTETFDSWFFGFAGEGKAQLEQACQSGVAEIRNFHSTEDVLLTVFSMGIYSPYSSRIVCARKQ